MASAILRATSSVQSISWQWLNVSKLPTRLITRLLSIVLSLMILTMATAASAALSRGDSGEAVSDLQNRLVAIQCYSGPVTGYFGELTQAAVIACQQRHNLEADGVVGPKTMAVLNGGSIAATAQPSTAQTAASNDLQQGSRGGAVMKLQQQLQDLGYYNGGIDGDFGPMTEAAVVQFQGANGLPQTGVVADREQQIIASARSQSAASTASTAIGRNQLALGDQGKDVQMLQQRLRELRFFDSASTGYYGEVTRAAVREFQSTNRISSTGIADQQTLQALGITLIAQAATAQSQPRRSVQANSPFSSGSFIEGNGTAIGGTATIDSQPLSTTAGNVAVSSSGRPSDRFVVIIPQREGVDVRTVRQLVPGATEGRSSIGRFIEAGAFPSQSDADRQSQLLRAYGLDARVAYR
jgi:peptidoglycan hydrolase-like protein with peptidoglycan-binding domain